MISGYHVSLFRQLVSVNFVVAIAHTVSNDTFQNNKKHTVEN